jgi:Leucine-rich repeat (LRR) protein
MMMMSRGGGGGPTTCYGVVFLVLTIFFNHVVATTNPTDTQALQAFHQSLVDTDGNLNDWTGNDPCAGWAGVYCEPFSSNISFVTELRLFRLNLGGTLVPELGNLSELIYLDVMWNHLTGSIPSTLGQLTNLYLLLLNGNQFTGILPPELGSLSNLNRIQIDENNISGPVPTTFQYLHNIKHLHMNNNSLNGSLPPGLGTLPNLVHILLDNNQLTGYLPPQFANAPNLLIIQLDNNQFASNATIPLSWGSIPTLLKLSLRNCGISGTIPSFDGAKSLEVLDLSNNKLTGTIPNTTSYPINLTSIDLSYNELNGEIPLAIGNLPALDLLVLRNNNLSGAIPGNLGSSAGFSGANATGDIDLQYNRFSSYTSNLAALESSSQTHIWVSGNPDLCQNTTSAPNPLCTPYNNSITVPFDSPQPIDFPPNACHTCTPITVEYRLKSPGFLTFDNYEAAFVSYLSSGLNLTEDQVVIQQYTWQPGPRLNMTILLLPAVNNTFNETEFQRLYTAFSTWQMPDSTVFGPYELISFNPRSLLGPSGKHLSPGAIVGIVLGAAALVGLVTALLLTIILRHRRTSAAISAQMARLTKSRNPALKVAGVKAFTYEELATATKQFSETNQVGSGGYGKVYYGELEDGQMVAIKRAQEGSLQGAHEFYTEIELLSRVHHRNLVMLLGYCDDEGEQMLVYEFMSGGTLRERLSPTHSKGGLDFVRRVRLALGSARGILYLHTEANPPIFHRDIKASNILLDENNNAKVADFGLSKLAPVPDLEGETPAHVSTVVKGTPGYLDPEYFLTHKLTDKSDVYSFGVVLLELVTGMQPISKGKNLVREVMHAHEAGTMHMLVDPHMGSCPMEALHPFIKLAISCCKSSPDERPSMAEVVRDLEDIMRDLAATFSGTYSFDDSLRHVEMVPLPDSYTFTSNTSDTSLLTSGTILDVAAR